MRASLVLVLLGAAPFALASACSKHDDCASLATCELPTSADAGDTETDAGKGYPAVPPPDGCVVSADPSSSPSCQDDKYALFVDGANGRDENAGTKLSPLKTLTAATNVDRLAGRRRIYVSSAPQPGNFVLPPGVSLVGAATKIEGVAGKGPTLTVVEAAEDVVLSDLVITSPATLSGESSIGIFVASKSASLYRLNVRAGSAGDGTRKDNEKNLRKESGKGAASSTSANACTCPILGRTTGGGGGASGQAGAQGTSDPLASKGGRTGQGGSSTCGVAAQAGADGAGGAGGTSLPVVATMDAEGWHATNGVDGKPGEPGGGGGGGGNGGGSGGCGGCGGGGGRGGGAGGSSLGIVAYQCTLTLVASTIVSDSAGNGADGAKGETGEVGAEGGGDGTCKGAQGGFGGGGGGGSGGAAGVSAPIARTGGDVKLGEDTTLTPGKSGTQGGRGEHGDAGKSSPLPDGQPGSDGAPGAAAPASTPILVLQ